jgi:hypothetical protein
MSGNDSVPTGGARGAEKTPAYERIAGGECVGVARKLLKKHGSKVTVREVEEFGMMMIEPVPF